MANRIHSKGPYTHEEYYIKDTGMYPGMLLKLHSNGGVIKHDQENGRAEAFFLEEDALQGKTIADVAVVDEMGMCILPGLGAEIRGLIQDGQTLAIGDRVVSGGDGTLKALGAQDSAANDVFVIGVSMEALDLSSSPVENVLCRIRITAGN